MNNSDSNRNPWHVVPKDSWRPIVAEYAERISRIKKYDPWRIGLPESALSDQRDTCPLIGTDDSERISVIKHLSVFGSSTAFVAIQAAQAVCDLWESGQLMLVPLNTRFILECWARVHFAVGVVIKMSDTNDIKKAKERAERLTFGSRAGIFIPRSEKDGDVKPIHIMDCLRSLCDAYPEWEESYAFLSESSHPSFIGNVFFMMAGPPISNWENRAFRDLMKPRLERCFDILETSVHGILEDARLLADLEDRTREMG